MTDNEIIKALEEFHHRILKTNLSYHIWESEMMAVCEALNLINRQKAEIERLQGENENWHHLYRINGDLIMSYDDKVKELRKKLQAAKVEAYNEIITNLKVHLCNYDLDNYHSFKAIDEDTIDAVFQEMVGE